MFAGIRQLAGPTVVITAVSFVCGTGCEKGITATDITTSKMDEAAKLANSHHEHMIDNAMLQDMTVVDHYFVPHTSEISGTGAKRLDRLAPYLITYGGVVRYETYGANDDLIDRRLEHVREYLALAGCDMDRVEVRRLISGGRGMAADDAIQVKQKGTAIESGGQNQAIMLPTGGGSQGSGN